jgi:hypothetical protein
VINSLENVGRHRSRIEPVLPGVAADPLHPAAWLLAGLDGEFAGSTRRETASGGAFVAGVLHNQRPISPRQIDNDDDLALRLD